MSRVLFVGLWLWAGAALAAPAPSAEKSYAAGRAAFGEGDFDGSLVPKTAVPRNRDATPSETDLQADERSLAVRLELLDDEATLTDERIDAAVAAYP